jgi:hypothetical protein
MKKGKPNVFESIEGELFPVSESHESVLKTKLICTARITYEATRGQWFQKSKRGRSWELWMKDKDGIVRFLTRIPCKRILWVVP